MAQQFPIPIAQEPVQRAAATFPITQAALMLVAAMSRTTDHGLAAAHPAPAAH